MTNSNDNCESSTRSDLVTVAVDSLGEGQGATFTVWIPLAPQSIELPSPEPSSLTSDLSGIHILVVDDDEDSRFIAFVLEQANASVTTADSGIDALQAFSQSIPDIIVSDISMPEMDKVRLCCKNLLRTENSENAEVGYATTPKISAQVPSDATQVDLGAGLCRHLNGLGLDIDRRK